MKATSLRRRVGRIVGVCLFLLSALVDWQRSAGQEWDVDKSEPAVDGSQEARGADVRLKIVRVQADDTLGPPLGPNDPTLPKTISDALANTITEGERPWLTCVEDSDTSCNFELRIGEKSAYLHPASGPERSGEAPAVTTGDAPESRISILGPINLQTGTDETYDQTSLSDYLRRIARARNLIGLALAGDKSAPQENQIKMELLRLEYDFNKQEVTDSKLWHPDDDEPLSVYAYRITNLGRTQPVYVTVLEIEPDLEIRKIMPYEGEDGPIKIEPSDTRDSGPFPCEDAVGLVNAIALATYEESNFSFLVHPEPSEVPLARPAGGAGVLTDLLEEQVYFTPRKALTDRLIPSKQPAGPWFAQVLSWRLTPEGGVRTRALPDRFPGPVSATPGRRYRARYYDEPDNEASEKKEPESVRVFYGTDRKRARAYNNRVSFCVAAALTAMFGVAAWRFSSRRKTMMFLSVVALVCTILLRPDYARITSRLYGYESGHELEMGMCTVTIPPEHKVGEVEAPEIYRLQFREDPQEHIVIQEIKPMGDGAFFTELQGEVQNKQGELFVYIHGYYNSFEYAAQRTAQMAYDLKAKYKYDAVPVFYSWPSQGTSLDYLADARAVKGAVRHLKDFLTKLASRSGARAVNVIAHSMGNRALTDALKEMQRAASEQSVMFNEVILAAPDVDKRLFCTEIAPNITKTAKRFTLYASSDDLLLAVSEMLHRAPRAGGADDPPPVLLDGVETIDATGIDTSLFGHTYIASSPLLLQDLSELLRSSRGADQRPWLRPRQHKGRVYWALSDSSGVEAENNPTEPEFVDTGPPSDTDDATTPHSDRPVVSRSSFQDETEIRDPLDLAAHVDKSLRDAASGGTDADFVFVDTPDATGAYRLFGRYRVEASGVTVTVLLVRGFKDLEWFDVSGEEANVDELARQIVAQTSKRMRRSETYRQSPLSTKAAQ